MLGRLKQKDRANYIYNKVHHPETYSESSQTSKKTFFLLKKRLFNNFRKKLYLRYLTGFWMCLCYHCVRNVLDWNGHLDIFWKKGIIHSVRTQHFPKSYHYILPDKHTYVRTEMQEMARNVSFSGNFLHVFIFLCTN